MKHFETLNTILTVLFFNILPCVLIGANFLFHIEQGRKEYLRELRAAARSRGEDPRMVTSKFPVWVHLVVILVIGLFTNFNYWLTDLKLGIIPVIIGIVTIVGVLFYIIVVSRTPYQARAWSHIGIMGAFILTYGLEGLKGGWKFLLIAIILILVVWLAGKIVARLLESHSIVRAPLRRTAHDVRVGDFSMSPQAIVTIAIITIAIIAIILII